MLKELLQKVLSGPMILLIITLELRMILQNIRTTAVANVLINISPKNIFETTLLLERFHQIIEEYISEIKRFTKIYIPGIK